MISDESLETWSELSAVRTTRAGTQVVLHIEQFDAQGRMAVEQWWTTVLLGLHGMTWDRCPTITASPIRPETIRSYR